MKKHVFLFKIPIVLATFLAFCSMPASAQMPKVENVFVVTFDGFRWQDFFAGADEDLLETKSGGVKEVEITKKAYWRSSAKERREVLLPFLWGTIAKQGQIFGDPSKNAKAELTNGRKFSYPGYSEIFCGFADDRINSNAKKNNPNKTVLEFLHEKPAYQGKVAVFCTWDVFPYIFRSSENGITMHAGWTPLPEKEPNARQKEINAMIEKLPHYWPGNTFDLVTMEGAKEHIRRHKPRVVYVGLGETDEWAHGRRYDLYLDAARHGDRYLRELWEFAQSMPEYRDKTALIVTTDHGRGATRTNWTDHSILTPTAEGIWIAVLGPTTPPLGVRENVVTHQKQVASSIAHLLGEDWPTASPKSAPPLPGIVK